ncbi:MAG: hypothetical protein ABI721_01145 [Candidatus Dojkabacteria bacterium]
MLDSSYNLKDSKFNIVYKIFFLKYNPISDKNIYIAHIINYDILKVTNLPFCLDAQDKCIQLLLDEEKNITKENTIIYTFFDLKKGIRVLPDIKIFSLGENKKKTIEQEGKVLLGGMVLIVPEGFLRKYKNSVVSVSKFFNPATNIDVVGSYDEAIVAIDNFKS